MKAICGMRRCRIKIGDQLYYIDDRIGDALILELLSKRKNLIIFNSDINTRNQRSR